MLDNIHCHYNIKAGGQRVEFGKVVTDNPNSPGCGLFGCAWVYLNARAVVASAQMIEKPAIEAADIKHGSNILIFTDDVDRDLPVHALDWVILPGGGITQSIQRIQFTFSWLWMSPVQAARLAAVKSTSRERAVKLSSCKLECVWDTPYAGYMG